MRGWVKEPDQRVSAAHGHVTDASLPLHLLFKFGHLILCCLINESNLKKLLVKLTFDYYTL
jgi:hypothetical protein